MQSEAIILLGVSDEEADHFLSLLSGNDELRCLTERAETKEQLLQKAHTAGKPVFIVSLRYITAVFPDFSTYCQVHYTDNAKILLCHRTELETAVHLLCNGFQACLVVDSLTTEKLVNRLQAVMHERQPDCTPVTEQAKPDLQKFYERFNRISSTTNDAVWEWNLADNNLWANDNHQQLYGLTGSDPVPTKEVWVERMHPDDRRRILDLQEQALSSDTNVFISEYRFRTKQGYKHLFDRCYIERNSNGTPVLMTGSMMDITERKVAEENILHANERFELIARTTNEALWELDIVTGYTWSNEIHQLLYGLTLQDGAPTLQQWEERIHPDERAAVLKSFYDVLSSNNSVWICEYRMINHEANVIAIYDRTYIVRNSEGKPVRMMGSMMDITERKKAEEALLNSEEKYRTLVEQATDAIFIADATGRFSIINPAAVKLSQYSEEELMQMTIYDLSDPDELNEKPFAFAAMQSEKGASSERRMRRKDGSIADIEINAKFLSDGRFLAFIRDITERKNAENELHQSYAAIRKLTSHLQQVREEERIHIARNIHDELGQLLTVLKMDISWLHKKINTLHVPAITQKTREVSDLINNTVQAVRRIAADLRPGLLDDLGLTAAIEWHLSEFGNRTGIQSDFFTDKSDLNLPAEQATSLFRIYQESMTNITRHADATHVTVELVVDNDCIVMRITDNGKGFDLAALGKRKTLGLLGMKERAEMMDGRFRISKQPEGGMQVEVHLPLSAGDAIEILQV